ncbi:MAG: VanZ family protein [Bacteroidales bacterium]|nr:VanZ family protein [Bacteroidales bacterium]
MISFIFSIKLWLRRTIGIAYLGTVALVSLMPVSNLPHITVYQWFDKAVHLSMYLGLSFLACWCFEITRKHMFPFYILLTGVFMWGLLMEILQRTMHNGRNFEFRDMIANLTGAIIGLLIYRFFDRKRIEIAERNSN